MLTFITFLNEESGKQLFTDNPIVLHCVPSPGNEAIAEDDNITFFVDITLPLTATVIQLQGKFVGGECIIELQENLRAYVDFTLPVALGITIQDTKGIVPFNLAWGLEDETGTIFSNSTLETYYAYLGGWTVFEFPAIFDKYNWLTKLEHYQGTENKKIPYELLPYLFFYLSPETTNIEIEFQFTGSTQQYNEAISTANKTVIFPLARTFSSITGLTNVKTIEVVISNNIFSQTFIFEIDRKFYRQKRIFIFQNSLGGLDTLCFTGERERSKESNRKVAKRNLRYDYKSSDSQSFTYAVEQSANYKQYSGYLQKEELRYLQDEFLTSENIWEVVSNQALGVVFRAVILETKKLDYDEDSVEPQAINFQYTYGL